MVLVVKNLPAHAGDECSIPGSERPPGEGNGSPHQYSCLEIPMDREAGWATLHGVAKSRTQLRVHVCVCVHTHTHLRVTWVLLQKLQIPKDDAKCI